MATSSAASAAAAAVNSGTDFWSQLDKQKVAGIGGSIPNAGVYLAQQAQAELAFNQAKAQAQAAKDRAFSQMGLLSSGAVDPRSQYGEYQTMLHDQALDYTAADEAAQQRGLGGGKGLGMQGEATVHWNAMSQNKAFQTRAADTMSAMTQAGQTALAARNQAFLNSKSEALAAADAQKAAAAQKAAMDAQTAQIAKDNAAALAEQQKFNAAQLAAMGGAGGVGGGDGSGGIPGVDMNDFRYGATIPQGYSDESIYNAAAANAPAPGAQVMHIMNQGMTKNINGTLYISIKYRMPDGTTDTEWIPIGAPDEGPQAAAPAPAPIPPPQDRSNATTATAAAAMPAPTMTWQQAVGRLSRVIAV